MFPIQLLGLALAGRTLLSKYDGSALSNKRKILFRQHPGTKFIVNRLSTAANSFQTLVKGFTSALSQTAKKPAGVDYYAVAKSFLPDNARLIIPQYPIGSRGIQSADLDGDSQNELIASFKLNNEVKTIILKKKNEQWYKAAEIGNSMYETISHRSVADITGEGKKQLLIGMTSKEKVPALYGYSLENGKVNEMFSRNYHGFETIPERIKSKYAAAKAHLAIWNKKDPDTDNIEVLHWNGSQLEPMKNAAPYYRKKIVPYYVQKIRQMPYNPSNWYNLADALGKAEIYKDALIAIEVGMDLDRKAEIKEQFLALKNRISGK